jgi:hypothetical protein
VHENRKEERKGNEIDSHFTTSQINIVESGIKHHQINK